MPLRVRIDAPEGGLRETSWALCEAVRSISKERLAERWGAVSPRALSAVEFRLKTLLDL
jgi:mRNA interferase MazF